MGHLDRDRTYRLFRERFYWPGMLQYVSELVSSCRRCIQAKAPHLPESAPLVNITTTYPMELVCIDYLGLEDSKGGYNNILVVTDHFTQYAQAYPTRNQTAHLTAKILFEESFHHNGFLDKLPSDQGRNFFSSVIQHLYTSCTLAGIKKTHTTPYHPMGNGITEKFNRTLLQMLRCLNPDQKQDWKSHLVSTTHAYNSTVHDSTGYSPFYLMFVGQPRLAVDVLFKLHGRNIIHGIRVMSRS